MCQNADWARSQLQTLASTGLNVALHCPAADEDESFLRRSAEKLPGHALALSMAKVWEVVREHKDLNLPAHRVSERASAGCSGEWVCVREWMRVEGVVESLLSTT